MKSSGGVRASPSEGINPRSGLTAGQADHFVRIPAKCLISRALDPEKGYLAGFIPNPVTTPVACHSG